MGYRSEIGILITLPQDKNEALLVEQQLKEAMGKELETCFSFKHFERKGIENTYDMLYVKTNCDLKWYGSYEEVRRTMDFVNTYEEKYCNEEEHSYCEGLHYLRIGESYDDMEEIIQGDPWEYINFIRSLSYGEE